jgi:Txe/YoeB family toxin of Txe-Axe toxin-antitoxin module
MSYSLQFSKTALADIEKHKKSGNKATLLKIEKLLNELIVHPTTGSGQPEILKHELAGRPLSKTNLVCNESFDNFHPSPTFLQYTPYKDLWSLQFLFCGFFPSREKQKLQVQLRQL